VHLTRADPRYWARHARRSTATGSAAGRAERALVPRCERYPRRPAAIRTAADSVAAPRIGGARPHPDIPRSTRTRDRATDSGPRVPGSRYLLCCAGAGASAVRSKIVGGGVHRRPPPAVLALARPEAPQSRTRFTRSCRVVCAVRGAPRRHPQLPPGAVAATPSTTAPACRRPRSHSSLGRAWFACEAFRLRGSRLATAAGYGARVSCRSWRGWVGGRIRDCRGAGGGRRSPKGWGRAPRRRRW
jgi:hypothetical protein